RALGDEIPQSSAAVTGEADQVPLARCRITVKRPGLANHPGGVLPGMDDVPACIEELTPSTAAARVRGGRVRRVTIGHQERPQAGHADGYVAPGGIESLRFGRGSYIHRRDTKYFGEE